MTDDKTVEEYEAIGNAVEKIINIVYKERFSARFSHFRDDLLQEARFHTWQRLPYDPAKHRCPLATFIFFSARWAMLKFISKWHHAQAKSRYVENAVEIAQGMKQNNRFGNDGDGDDDTDNCLFQKSNKRMWLDQEYERKMILLDIGKVVARQQKKVRGGVPRRMLEKHVAQYVAICARMMEGEEKQEIAKALKTPKTNVGKKAFRLEQYLGNENYGKG